MNKQRIIFLCGLPASGKTTWALKYVEEHTNTVRVSKDDIREKYHNGVYSKENEQEVLIIQLAEVVSAINDWKDVIIDNTHLFSNHEKKYRGLAESFDIGFEVVDTFLSVSIAECILRDSKREWKQCVWEKVIRDMARNAWTRDKEASEFAEVIQSFWENSYIFDIDWTLAKMEGRSPHDESRVGEDTLHIDVAWILRELAVNNRIIICSWRSDGCRQLTVDWLEKYEIKYDELFMRKAGDKRNDAIIKHEILINDIIPKYYVRWVFDDRKRVVKMWRQCGIRAYQVQDGNF